MSRSGTFYDYDRLLGLLDAQRAKYKADFVNPKDREKNRVAVIIVNAITDAKRQVQEIITAIEDDGKARSNRPE